MTFPISTLFTGLSSFQTSAGRCHKQRITVLTYHRHVLLRGYQHFVYF